MRLTLNSQAGMCGSAYLTVSTSPRDPRPPAAGGPHRTAPGFTLIELLVVISIIALLIGILLPALGAARDTARSMQCLSNVRSMAQGAYTFSLDYKGHTQVSSTDLQWSPGPIPSDLNGRVAIWQPRTGTPGSQAGRIKDWASALVPYMGSDEDTDFEVADPKVSKIFLCPSDPNQGPPPDGGYIVYNNITDGPDERKPISYGVNADVTTWDGTAKNDGRGDWAGSANIEPWPGGAGSSPVSGNLDKVKSPSSTMLFGDCGTRVNNTSGNLFINGEILFFAAHYGLNPADANDKGTVRAIYEQTGAYNKLPLPLNNAPDASAERHKDAMNFAFVDGHGSSHSVDGLGEVYISPHK